MAKHIIDYSKGKRIYIKHLCEHGFLGISETIENKDLAMFIAALGIDSPKELTSKDTGGWFRTESITRYADDKAYISSFLLGTACTDDDFDRSSKIEEYADYFEKCAENGFAVLEEKIQEANGDNELLERKMLRELDYLYTKNVEVI